MKYLIITIAIFISAAGYSQKKSLEFEKMYTIKNGDTIVDILNHVAATLYFNKNKVLIFLEDFETGYFYKFKWKIRKNEDEKYILKGKKVPDGKFKYQIKDKKGKLFTNPDDKGNYKTILVFDEKSIEF